MSATASALPESVQRGLAPVPETRGQRVVVLEPIKVTAPLPPGFVDIDALVEDAEQDTATREAIAVARQAVADHYYADGPRTLAWYRLRKGWSQKELAARMNTSQSYIARLEAGAIDPQVSTVTRMSTVLDVLPADLLAAIAGAPRS